ncbi:MAG: NAD(+) diphosphatase [Methanospirillum sp.]|nr:NAD(+) diphosphatase [Methanospirillum sp.]
MLTGSPPPDGARTIPLGTLGGAAVHAVPLAPGAGGPAGFAPLGLRSLFGLVGDEDLGCAGRAVQLDAFHRDHRFCGACGTATAPSPGEHARVCPGCGVTVYPRVSPAVIVLIERDGACLLARSPRFPPGVFSAVAGFVEPGETVEHAVGREVMEEVGVAVTGLRYAGSQPWPFPHSLMIAFFATWAGGEVQVDGHEVEDADWFRADALPPLPPPGSIARRLIGEYADRHGRDAGPARPRGARAGSGGGNDGTGGDGQRAGSDGERGAGAGEKV